MTRLYSYDGSARMMHMRMLQSSRRPSSLVPAAVALVVCNLSTVAIFAQKPAAAAKPEGTSFLPWIIALGILFVVGITAFLNPKRSHLG